MARLEKKLTAVSVAAIKSPGRYNDGAGLYLLVKPDGGKYWVFRYRDRRSHKLRDKGLGPVGVVPLAKARQIAAMCRVQLSESTDPIDSSRAEKERLVREHASRVSLGKCAESYIASKRAGWRNAKHAAQWASTLNTYCGALMGRPADAIGTQEVLGALKPIWQDKTETASRVRQRLEAVLDWATANGFRSGENPARWRGHLQKLLPAPEKVKAATHRPALPYVLTPGLVSNLLSMRQSGARALLFQILTASRPSEAAGADWSEVSLQDKTWTIPRDRMKSFRPHVVPLSDGCIDLLTSLRPQVSGPVFPGMRERPITTAAMLKVLHRLHPHITSHGFRSTFRDWSADRTEFSRDVIEAALAHSLKDKTEAAYLRTTMLDKRAQLMQSWWKYCSGQ